MDFFSLFRYRSVRLFYFILAWLSNCIQCLSRYCSINMYSYGEMIKVLNFLVLVLMSFAYGPHIEPLFPPDSSLYPCYDLFRRGHVVSEVNL